MTVPIMSRRRSNFIFNGLFLIGLALLTYVGTYWPWILIVVGFPMALRQLLRGRIYDMFVSIFVFGGLFIYFWGGWESPFIIPVLFTLAGIFLLFRAFFAPEERPGEEGLEDTNQELLDSERDELEGKDHPRR